MNIRETDEPCAVTKRNLICCACFLVLAVASVMFKHPTDPLPYQKLKYSHRTCYNESRAPQRARFPGRCLNCRGAVNIGDPIEPHAEGRLWKHISCSATMEAAPPNALVLHQLAASAVLCVDEGDIDLSSAAALSFEEAYPFNEPAPKRSRTDDTSSSSSSQDTGVTDVQTPESQK
jgi:hypothetical protein